MSFHHNHVCNAVFVINPIRDCIRGHWAFNNLKEVRHSHLPRLTDASEAETMHIREVVAFTQRSHSYYLSRAGPGLQGLQEFQFLT